MNIRRGSGSLDKISAPVGTFRRFALTMAISTDILVAAPGRLDAPIVALAADDVGIGTLVKGGRMGTEASGDVSMRMGAK